MTVTIRPATPADAAALVPLIQVLGRDVPESLVRDFLATGGNTVLVAEDGAAPLGVVAINRSRLLHRVKPDARITTLAVATAAQGRGVGRQLVEAAIDQAREWGCARLELTTYGGRLDAQAFYRAVGFQQEHLRFHRELD